VRKALVTGITGQDGSYLAQHLLRLGYEVIGTSSSITPNMSNIETLGIKGQFPIVPLNMQCLETLDGFLLDHKPTHIFSLGSLSSVSASFANPSMAERSIFHSTKAFLDSIQRVNPDTKFFHPSSSEMFGDIESMANENSSCKPVSPYGLWKMRAHQLIRESRENKGLPFVSGILFNHESPLRGTDFFSRKLIRSAVEIYLGKRNSIEFGNLDGIRDWGWAPDYVVVMELIINQGELRDLVVATGVGHSLQFLVTETFSLLGLDWEKFVKIDQSNFRPRDIKRSVGDPTSAERYLSWRNSKSIHEMLESLIEAELSRCAS
jgi:GDPmannose 4,6-dehydratase